MLNNSYKFIKNISAILLNQVLKPTVAEKC